MHGEPLEHADFSNFSYANPDAPKGGQARFAQQGSYDNLNPFIVKGVSGDGVREYVYETLMARAYDEPFTLYGLIAESIETPPDRSWVEFTLNPAAKFSDGTPITVEDVIFSHAVLRDHGRPNHRSYYKKVVKVEKTGERSVRFTFDDSGDREMPLIMGLMPILPSHALTPESFEQTTLDPPLGSGPYVVDAVDPGKSLTFKRNPNYWGRDLPVNRGRYNFDEIRVDYFRDASSMFEAFKSGLVDLREELSPNLWAQGYDFPALRQGKVVTEALPIETPAGMSALVFNTRRPIFADPRVRQALIRLFDYTWIDRTLYHDLFAYTQSYFARSELSSHGRPADATERALLAPFPDAVKPEIMDGTFSFAASEGAGQNREGRIAALKLLNEAGYVLRNGTLVNAETGEPFTFEILARTRSQERLLLTYADALKRVGIDVSIRQVDSAQYERRKQTFEFDMIPNYWGASLSPGNEQSFRWGSQAAKTEGSFNLAGVENEAVDAMIAAMLEAKTREDFVSAVRALDRVLLSGDYVVPLFYLPDQWVARWTRLQRPNETPLYGYQVDTWWYDQDQDGRRGTRKP
ncbi:extracellular solute-binding protein [Methyloceanibacter caenitepidi]|uniref:ABC transporter, periplasmic substrate-binding protein n=1 Tax=Methyloceanibacter caenitepidi TaxID=1384459 RepID=A0A0A8K4E5_9HYPH|nr:extracellular solute-binding protein [Methyloceanibacter caenitepidi]BAQ17372.1 ABC transporter, periplasmic substrate-binding protein [Methyloceanibacter caenitepidi]